MGKVTDPVDLARLSSVVYVEFSSTDARVCEIWMGNDGSLILTGGWTPE